MFVINVNFETNCLQITQPRLFVMRGFTVLFKEPFLAMAILIKIILVNR